AEHQCRRELERWYEEDEGGHGQPPRDEQRNQQQEFRAPPPTEEQRRRETEDEEHEREDLAMAADGGEERRGGGAEENTGRNRDRQHARRPRIGTADRDGGGEQRRLQRDDHDRLAREVRREGEHDEPEPHRAEPTEREERQPPRDQLPARVL